MSLLLFVGALALATPQDLSAYEGIGSDDFAAWSFTSGDVTVDGDAHTTSVLARYVTPLPVENSSVTVAYSIHRITFHCAARTSDWTTGMNYTADGSEIVHGTAATGEPWSENTPGFVELATQVCALEHSL